MEKEKESIVPAGPSELCFDSKAFVEESFSVDKFLQDHRNKADLETMRDDLGVYLKVLRSALIDLINKDYADFVNLSRNLIGLDIAIKKIQSPLGQLKEELLEVRLSLDGAMKEVANQLALKKELRERKRSLRSLSRVHTSLKKLRNVLLTYEESQNIILLERAAIEYCQLNFHVHKCQRDIDEPAKMDYESVGSTLLNSVDKLFLNSIALGEKGKPNLIRCLNYYQALNKITNAEKLYKDKIVEPSLKDLITENYLKSLPRGLPALYEKILQFVEEKMKILIEVSKENNKRSGTAEFDFFLKSFWPVVQKRLESNLLSIYAAGDPDLFFQRYSDTTEFLENLFRTCEPHTLDQLYNDENYSSFLERWNLPVYFQLRYQYNPLAVCPSFPKELKLLLSKLWESFLKEDPEDEITFALNFFLRLKNCNVCPIKLSQKNLSRIRRSEIVGKKRIYDASYEIYLLAHRFFNAKPFILNPYNFKTDVEKDRLFQLMKKNEHFKKLNDTNINLIYEYLIKLEVVKDQKIITKGDFGNYIYIVDKGSFNNYGEGDFFDDILMFSDNNSQTITALSDGLLWALEIPIFRSIVVKNVFVHHLLRNLHNNSFFNGIKKSMLIKIVKHLRLRTYKPKEVVFQTGDISDGLYILYKGAIVDSGEKLWPITCFGFEELEECENRTRSIVAETEIQSLFLHIEDYRSYFLQH